MIQINRREKAALTVAAGFVAVFMVLQFIVFPILDRKKILERQQSAQREALGEIQLLVAEYRSLQEQVDRSRSKMARKQPGFTLFSFLDQLAGRTRIKSHITYMKPSSSIQKETNYKISTVEMKLESIDLDKLVGYLHAVETSKNMIDIRRLSLTQTGKSKNLLDAVLEIQTIDIS